MNTDGSIRVSRGIRVINVNDDGDCITLPVADSSFTTNFFKLIDEIRRRGMGLYKKAQTLDTKDLSDTANLNEDEWGKTIDPYLSFADTSIEVSEDIMRKTDELFGEGTCLKVFGKGLPSIDRFVEFYGLLVPFIEEYTNERQEKMNKYGSERTGSAL